MKAYVWPALLALSLPIMVQAQAQVGITPASLNDPHAIRVLLSPELETTLVAQMMGSVTALSAGLGATVKKGQLLVEFDCAEAAARLQMAQAEQSSAKETLAVKTNLKKLDAAGDLEVSLARSEARRAEAAVALNRAQMQHCKITAPFNGRVVKSHIKLYQGVSVGAPLLELVSSGPLKLRLNVPSQLLRSLKVGSPLEVEIDETGGIYPAKVSAINGRVDAVAQTVELEARLDQASPELLPGMSGVARFAPANAAVEAKLESE